MLLESFSRVLHTAWRALRARLPGPSHPAPPAVTTREPRPGIYHVVLSPLATYGTEPGFSLNIPCPVHCAICRRRHLLPLFLRKRHFTNPDRGGRRIVITCSACAGQVPAKIPLNSPGKAHDE